MKATVDLFHIQLSGDPGPIGAAGVEAIRRAFELIDFEELYKLLDKAGKIPPSIARLALVEWDVGGAAEALGQDENERPARKARGIKGGIGGGTALRPQTTKPRTRQNRTRTPITPQDLPLRVRREIAGTIKTVEALAKWSEDELRDEFRFRVQSINRIRALLASHDLSLKSD